MSCRSSLTRAGFRPHRALEIMSQYGDTRDVMLSKAKHLVFSSCYEEEILHLRLRMTLKGRLAAISGLRQQRCAYRRDRATDAE